MTECPLCDRDLTARGFPPLRTELQLPTTGRTDILLLRGRPARGVAGRHMAAEIAKAADRVAPQTRPLVDVGACSTGTFDQIAKERGKTLRSRTAMRQSL